MNAIPCLKLANPLCMELPFFAAPNRPTSTSCPASGRVTCYRVASGSGDHWTSREDWRRCGELVLLTLIGSSVLYPLRHACRMCETTFSGDSAGRGSDSVVQRRAVVYPVSIVVSAMHSLYLVCSSLCWLFVCVLEGVCYQAGAHPGWADLTGLNHHMITVCLEDFNNNLCRAGC